MATADDTTPLQGVGEDQDLGEVRKKLAEAKDRAAAKCGEELQALLKRHDCTLASHQVLINGVAQGPAQIVVVPNHG